MNNSEQNNLDIRVAMVGAAGVGKTEIMRRLLGEDFRAAYHPTEQNTVVVCIEDVRFLVTEYSGQRFYTANDFADVTAYIVVSSDSRADARYAKSIRRLMPDNIPFCQIENKSDISARTLPNSCSAKKKENLEYAFHAILNQLQA